MKANKFFIVGMLLIGTLAYGEEGNMTVEQEIANTVNSIEAEYQELLQKEAEKKQEFMVEKSELEKEVATLKEKQIGKEELYAKLKKDSEIRWHRDQYKKLLKKYDVYYDKLEKTILEKEQKISELTGLLEALQ
ncbi:adhesion protein FadA [Fusobacterium massiliense]|uniref:adhesion protein FadA n=1 Tax=Fusobacterium massiliense TaxID=1852365 RepID=UPI000938E930|nr:adhesion protein FadA [Fusobacterium massiliense]